jgi:hypothetical protein
MDFGDIARGKRLGLHHELVGLLWSSNNWIRADNPDWRWIELRINGGRLQHIPQVVSHCWLSDSEKACQCAQLEQQRTHNSSPLFA